MRLLLIFAMMLILQGCKQCERTDVNCDGTVDVLDIQLVTNDYLDG